MTTFGMSTQVAILETNSPGQRSELFAWSD
jgi:hypothetical protein